MKRIRVLIFDGLTHVERNGETLIIRDWDNKKEKRVKLTLKNWEIVAVAEQLHAILKKRQDELDEAKRAMRGA